MAAFRTLLLVIILGFGAYSLFVMTNHGMDFVTPFIGDILVMDWSGQFNLDFALYMMLSALWIAWRHAFSPPGLAIAAVCSVFGMMVFAPYLLIAASNAKGDIRVLLLGEERAAA